MTTHRSFFKGFLIRLGIPVRPQATRALAVVSIYESSQGNIHWNNPLAVTLYWPGATPYNTFGNNQHVWRYLTPQDGEAASAKLFSEPHWDEVRHQMLVADTRHQVLDAFSKAYSWASVDFRTLPFNNLDDIVTRLDHILQPYATHD
jgi:hypothetical protein